MREIGDVVGRVYLSISLKCLVGRDSGYTSCSEGGRSCFLAFLHGVRWGRWSDQVNQLK